MKNRIIERLKIAAKRYHLVRRGDHFRNGIIIFHRYAASDDRKLSWWDHVTFILNDYRVALAWVHPRKVYDDLIGDEVSRLTADFPCPAIMKTSTPIYKTAGKSRKTVSLWRYEPVDLSDWREQRNRVRQQVMQTADYQITPSLTSGWCKYSRFVTLCAPFEVHSEDDLHALAALTKRLLRREVSLEDLFPGYRYTRADWEHDGLHLADHVLYSHEVAI